MHPDDILSREIAGSIAFFQHHTNLKPGSPGYGLTVDSTKDPSVASIAAVGFALSAWVIAAERGLIERGSAQAIVRGTLDTLLERASHHRGFFAHFLDMETASRLAKCEYSTIDTALCLNGVLTAEAYFGDPAISDLAARLLERVDWRFLVFEHAERALFHMAYNPDRGGDYVTGDPGFISRWDMAAEQKMMYLQAAPRLESDLARRLYAGFERDTALFEGRPIIFNPGGNLFAYQFSEAWLDTRRYLDPDGVDWFENTRLATLANRAYCIAQAGSFATYGPESWGISCGDSPWGYDVSGAPPTREAPKPNGTVSIYGALSSLPFAPEPVLAMAAHLVRDHPQTWGPYGFYDAYNLAVSPAWYSRDLYGIDKGCSLLMIENYLSGLIWETYTESRPIHKALEVLRFTRRPMNASAAASSIPSA
ncbi:MAG TPA: glucoamylase family protein [Anaerolineales bacterium]|nr:glucoamylase family protein [Anaerolineales bacterium]